MYLADKIIQCSAPIEVHLRGVTWVLPGAYTFSQSLNECPTRYVLLNDVHEACCQLAERWADLLAAPNPKLRAPMEDAWVEWTDSGTGEQVGMLVNSTGDGRSGRLRSFWTQEGEVYIAQGEVLFDFDHRINFTRAEGRPLYALRSLSPEFAQLRPHLSLAIDQAWAEYFRATKLGPDGLPEAASMCGERLWPDVVRVLAFFILLASRAPFSKRLIDRERLNVARAKAGKKPLLDHVELRLTHQASDASDGGEAGIGRKHPRLHMVRGHMVRRRDSVFWRVAHVRGGAAADAPMPTTRVVRMG